MISFGRVSIGLRFCSDFRRASLGFLALAGFKEWKMKVVESVARSGLVTNLSYPSPKFQSSKPQYCVALKCLCGQSMLLSSR